MVRPRLRRSDASAPSPVRDGGRDLAGKVSAIVDAPLDVREARITQEIVTADLSAKGFPVPFRVQEHQLNETPVARPVGARQREPRLASGRRHLLWRLSLTHHHIGGEDPQGRGQQGDVHDRGLACAERFEQRARNPIGHSNRRCMIAQRRPRPERRIHAAGRRTWAKPPRAQNADAS